MADQMGFSLDNAPIETDEAEVVQPPQPMTIAELNQEIRTSIEGDFKNVWVRGEISNFKPHSSGHFYFSLKDETSQIGAIMFRGQTTKLKFKPTNGMEVFARGKVTVYMPRGQYSLNCDSMEPVGAGALQRKFEELKAKLQAEGLFDPAKKRPLPAFPKHIGLVTSPTGAAVQDILNVLGRRFPGARVTISPAVVQGDAAPASIVKALELINRVNDIDVLIIGRGGGSIEDMWCFNDEKVARAIAASRLPIISAVGHEIDFTIADFVADLRAPTPSAAAELVSKNAGEIAQHVLTLKKRIVQALQTQLLHFRRDVQNFTSRLVDPQRYLQDLALRADELTTRLENAVIRYFDLRRSEVELAVQKMGTPRERIHRLHRRLESASLRMKSTFDRNRQKSWLRFREAISKLEALSPLKVLDRGYSVVKAGTKIVTSYQQVKPNENVTIEFAEGKASAIIQSVEAKGMTSEFNLNKGE